MWAVWCRSQPQATAVGRVRAVVAITRARAIPAIRICGWRTAPGMEMPSLWYRTAVVPGVSVPAICLVAVIEHGDDVTAAG